MMIVFSATINEMNKILQQMHADDAAVQPTAIAAYKGIVAVYRTIPPVDLNMPVEQPPIEYPEGLFD
ncbi:hypothetical protein CPB85DRAFT_1338652 [Mucidula mucida]|nr:hypothetical protein CPB85DRAFT_1338652 [Mucidula mucida]